MPQVVDMRLAILNAQLSPPTCPWYLLEAPVSCSYASGCNAKKSRSLKLNGSKLQCETVSPVRVVDRSTEVPLVENAVRCRRLDTSDKSTIGHVRSVFHIRPFRRGRTSHPSRNNSWRLGSASFQNASHNPLAPSPEHLYSNRTHRSSHTTQAQFTE